MVKINKIYTKAGDGGKTHLTDGSKVDKDSPRVIAYGAVDELNAYLGWAATLAEESGSDLVSKLKQIQNRLFDLGSELATPAGADLSRIPVITPEDSKELEDWIDQITEDLPELKSFVLPGGTILNSALHICRTICRRAEIEALKLSKQEKVSSDLLIYLNRLSDAFFCLCQI